MSGAKGSEFEKWLIAYHDVLRMIHRADVDRCYPPMQITGRSGAHVRCRLGAKVGVDFAGTLAGGRSVYVEAKESSEPKRFPWADAVKEHQRAYLAAKERMGALCLLVVQRNDGTRRVRYAVPVEALGSPGASWTWEQMDAAGWRWPEHGGWWEWVEVRR